MTFKQEQGTQFLECSLPFNEMVAGHVFQVDVPVQSLYSLISTVSKKLPIIVFNVAIDCPLLDYTKNLYGRKMIVRFWKAKSRALCISKRGSPFMFVFNALQTLQCRRQSHLKFERKATREFWVRLHFRIVVSVSRNTKKVFTETQTPG